MPDPNQERPQNISIATSADWHNGIITFTKIAENGIALVNPPVIMVPLFLIMRIASEAIHRSLPPNVQQMNLTPAPQLQMPERRDIGKEH